jgi:hypothetical protein
MFIEYEDKAKTALSSHASQEMSIDTNLPYWLVKSEELGLYVTPLIYYMYQTALASNIYGDIILNNRTNLK